MQIKKVKDIGIAGVLGLALSWANAYAEKPTHAEPANAHCPLKKSYCETTRVQREEKKSQKSGEEYDSQQGMCAKPEEGISFSNLKNNSDLFFQSHEDVEEGEVCGWRFYRGSKKQPRPKMSLQEIGVKNQKSGYYTGFRVEYTHPEDEQDARSVCKQSSWLGIYHPFRAYDCGYTDGYRCADFSEKTGMILKARGDGKLRVQLMEGYEGCVNFGEAYEHQIVLSSEWKEYMVPFEQFVYRADWQMGEEELSRIRKKGISSRTVSEYFDCIFDVSKIQSLTLEGLCQDSDSKCRQGEKRYFEVKDILFYGGKNNDIKK